MPSDRGEGFAVLRSQRIVELTAHDEPILGFGGRIRAGAGFFRFTSRRLMSMRFWGTVCVAASLFMACDDREDRIPGLGGAGTEPAAAGGQPEESEASGGMAGATGSEHAAAKGGVTGEGGVGNSGGVEGMTEGENLTSDTATQPWQSQLGHLTVTAVEPTTEPATHDFLD